MQCIRHRSSCKKMVKTKKFVLVKHFVGEPKETDFKLVEEELPPIKDGEILCEAVWLSVDPYMRQYSVHLPLGSTMIGAQTAKVLESRHKDYKVGMHIVAWLGWQTRSVVNIEKSGDRWLKRPYIVPEMEGIPLSLSLGTLGRVGNTAYFGLLELCKPKPGEVVVVSGAAGAVGNHVGQIAKIMGCKVIGFAGSEEKVKWLTEELKFDFAFNYKTADVQEALKKAAPEGIDCYFDNVGGFMSSVVISQMNEFGRIAVCGAISSYNADVRNIPQAPIIQPAMVSKQLRMEGFIAGRWLDRFDEGIAQNYKWIKEGKLKYRETITDGFENMPKAFIGMLKGENIGKAVVKA